MLQDNVDYFEFGKTFDPCKNSTKILSNCYNGIISIIHQPYMFKILPIPHKYQTRIASNFRAIFHSFEFGKNLKIRTPPQYNNSQHFELWTFWFSAWTPPPPLNFSHFLGHFFSALLSLRIIWMERRVLYDYRVSQKKRTPLVFA